MLLNSTCVACGSGSAPVCLRCAAAVAPAPPISVEGVDRCWALMAYAGVGRELIRLNPLIRPLVERLWAARVVVYNRLPDGRLDEFLFRRARLDATRVRLALWELQDQRCFYTAERLRPGEADVDHFVPWSRSPLNAIENLVVADRRVNNRKRDHLAAASLVERWRDRNDTLRAELAQVAAVNRWETGYDQTLGVARALYLSLDARTLLWVPPDEFVPADLTGLRHALAA